MDLIDKAMLALTDVVLLARQARWAGSLWP
jgi:hypothetical protein